MPRVFWSWTSLQTDKHTLKICHSLSWLTTYQSLSIHASCCHVCAVCESVTVATAVSKEMISHFEAITRTAAIFAPRYFSPPADTKRWWQTHTFTDRCYTNTCTQASNLIKLLTKDKGFLLRMCVVCTGLCYKQRPGFFAFWVQFNSCPNLLSNYANEFIVGGSLSWLSRDLDSLEKGQNVSLAHVWQCKRSRRGKQRKRESRSRGKVCRARRNGASGYWYLNTQKAGFT